jgi:hypothetical protein
LADDKLFFGRKPQLGDLYDLFEIDFGLVHKIIIKLIGLISQTNKKGRLIVRPLIIQSNELRSYREYIFSRPRVTFLVALRVSTTSLALSTIHW